MVIRAARNERTVEHFVRSGGSIPLDLDASSEFKDPMSCVLEAAWQMPTDPQGQSLGPTFCMKQQEFHGCLPNSPVI